MLFSASMFGQEASTGNTTEFVPMALHGPRSVELMQAIDRHLAANDRSFADIPSSKTNDAWIEHVRVRQASLLKRMVRARAFINNDTLQEYVETYFRRLAVSNGLSEKPRLVLLMNSPESNAACYGSGVFIVTSGLLANMPDASSLAFILAHEIAHDELLHVQQSLQALSQERGTRNPRAAFARILLADVNEEYIDAFRTTLYASAAMSREHELQADSLACVLLQRAGYAPNSGAKALEAMTSFRHADKNDLFSPMKFTDFPFKDHWLDERLKVYHRNPANTFLWSFDSLRSHPQMDRRIEVLSQYATTSHGRSPGVDNVHGNSSERERIARAMGFQSIEAAYQTNQYDIALFSLLRLLKTYPGDPYLVSRTAGILIDMYHAKNEGSLEVLSPFTSSLSDSERMVNNFLFNMSKEEVAELAYHFMNNRHNFDESSAAHFYLLWQTCQLTSRESVKSKVAAAYRARFGSDIQFFHWE